jgi:hypothetical protein
MEVMGGVEEIFTPSVTTPSSLKKILKNLLIEWRKALKLDGFALG